MNNVIRDEKLKAALNKQYLNQPADQVITKDQLANLQGTVTLDNKEIKDLTGMSYATQITALYLNHNEIIDITPLKDMVNLRQISLMNNQIKDYSPAAAASEIAREIFRLGRPME